MKKGLLALLSIFLILAACTTTKTVQVEQPNPSTTTANAPTTTVKLSSEFKLMQEVAKKSPATVFGIVKNIGNATGSVKVTARVYYAKVIVDENSQTLDNIGPEEEANFSISIDPKAQWTSYKATLETVN